MMIADRSDFPKHSNFSQRYGYEQLPQPMKLEEISPDLRREIWDLIYWIFEKNKWSTDWGTAFKREFSELIRVASGRFEKRPISEIDIKYNDIKNKFKHIIMRGEFNRLLDFLEILVDVPLSSELPEEIKDLFKKHSAAYWLDLSCKPYGFVPCSSEEQKNATQHALETIQQAGMDGARSHLNQAVRALNERRYPDSVRESIHAVESVARKIDPQSRKSRNSLGRALKPLKNAGVLKHPALIKAFEMLYGYTSNEEGIRHSLVFKETADVGEEEAIFMFGACASFAAYLTQKSRQAAGGK